ncbi:endonuclease/exonuclease/phosphatase family protein [bacterium]|nr:endonuclease/exonuclease/phosphatase family protein [bacterium]
MAKAFSVASWNIENMGRRLDELDHIIDFLLRPRPDIVALYEVTGKDTFEVVTQKMPDYTFHITEGPQVQEILVGVRHGITAFFTQKTQFKSAVPVLRPGALLTATVAGERYSLLFLHAKSMPDPRGWGLRDDTLKRACKFRKTLDGAAGGTGKANYIFLGDLNTMGLKYPFKKSMEADFELRKLDRQAKRRKMRRLTKDEPHTWWNGSQSKYAPADLDHVVAAQHLRFKEQGGAEVLVDGWPKEPTVGKKDAWIKKYSDHGMLYFEVQRV